MTNVVAFKPRPRPPEPAPLPAIDLRTHLEDAVQTALDAVEKVMVALDHLEGSDGADLLSVAMLHPAGQAEGAGGSWDQYRAGAREAGSQAVPVSAVEQVQEAAALAEPELPDTELEEVDAPDPCPEPIRLSWRGAGNVVSAAGCAIIALVVGAA